MVTSGYPQNRGVYVNYFSCCCRNGHNSLTIHHYGTYNFGVTNGTPDNIDSVLKQQRLSIPLTLKELATAAKVSASHLGRIERGQHFPSGRIFRRIARPLGLEENEIFTLAGYLSPQPPSIAENGQPYAGRHLDPLVARLPSQEPVEVQRHVVSILNILKSLPRSLPNEDQGSRKA